MLRPGRLRTGWMVASAVLRARAASIFTATRVDLTKLTNELQFRGDAHASLVSVLHEPGGHARAALRAADRAQPQARARRALDPRPAARPRARARRPGAAAHPRRGVALYVTSRFAIFRHAFTNPVDPTSDPGPAGRLAARSRRATTSPPMPAAERAAGCGRRPSPRSCSARSGCGCGASATACRSSTTPTRTRTSWPARSACSGTPTTRTTSSTRRPSRTCCTPRSRSASAAATASRRPTRPTRRNVFALARALSGVLGRGRGRAAGVGGRAAVRPPHRLRRRRAAGGGVPARPLRATSRSTTCRRSRRCASRSSASAASSRAGGCSTTRSPASASGSPARRSTPAGSCCCRCSPPLRVGRDQAAARRVGGLALAGVLALAAFLIANPFALLDFDSFRDGLSEQSAASSDGGGKLGLTASSGIAYYLGTHDLGARLAARARGARRGGRARGARLAARARARAAARPVPALHGHAGPLLRALAAADLSVPVPARRLRRGRRPLALAAAPGAGRPRRSRACCCARRGSCSRSTTTACSPATTRASSRATGWSSTSRAGTKVVIEPVVPDSWASDPGRALRGTTGNGARWAKWPTSRSRGQHRRHAAQGRPRADRQARGLRAHAVPAARRQYADRGYCRVLTGSTQFGRALAEPEDVPRAITYYDELRRSGRVVFADAPAACGRSRSTSPSTPTRCRSTAQGRRS